MCILTEDDEGSYDRQEGYINERVSKIVVVEMGRESLEGKSREQSRRNKCISNNKENWGGEK